MFVAVVVLAWVTARLEDAKKSKNKMWSDFGPEEIAPGCPINDRWGVGMHFASN
jgi:hypothetical protein